MLLAGVQSKYSPVLSSTVYVGPLCVCVLMCCVTCAPCRWHPGQRSEPLQTCVVAHKAFIDRPEWFSVLTDPVIEDHSPNGNHRHKTGMYITIG